MTHITIKLKTEIYRKLEALAQGFNDSPQSVIERLADNALGGTMKKRSSTVSQVSDNATEQIYLLAHEVFEAYEKGNVDGKRAMNNAMSQLEEMGLHRGSCRIYILAYISMKRGESYKMSINLVATRYFLTKIMEQDGSKGLQMALKALRAHVKYRNKNGINNPGLESLHAEFSEKRLTL